jgi:hypothetical protein
MNTTTEIAFGLSLSTCFRPVASLLPSYPPGDLEVYCAVGDLVCTGTLIITAAHFSYAVEAAGPAPTFLEGKIDVA